MWRLFVNTDKPPHTTGHKTKIKVQTKNHNTQRKASTAGDTNNDVRLAVHPARKGCYVAGRCSLDRRASQLVQRRRPNESPTITMMRSPISVAPVSFQKGALNSTLKYKEKGNAGA